MTDRTRGSGGATSRPGIARATTSGASQVDPALKGLLDLLAELLGQEYVRLMKASAKTEATFTKPKEDWVVREDEALRIIGQPLWDCVQRRLQEVGKTWPGGKGRPGFSREQGGRVASFPTHLLSGAMNCGVCGASIALVSGKGAGYYGCLGAVKGACDNKVLVPRRLAEDIILAAVRERIAQAGALRYVMERVEREVREQYEHVPETIRLKTTEFNREKRRLGNLLNRVGEGWDSQELKKALEETERRVCILGEELDGLQHASEKVMRAPPAEWIEERLVRIRAVLEARTERSALMLRQLLGPIRLEPVKPDIGRPYYVARTALDTLVLLDDPGGDGGPEGGSNSSRWWKRQDVNAGNAPSGFRGGRGQQSGVCAVNLHSGRPTFVAIQPFLAVAVASWVCGL